MYKQTSLIYNTGPSLWIYTRNGYWSKSANIHTYIHTYICVCVCVRARARTRTHTRNRDTSPALYDYHTVLTVKI